MQPYYKKPGPECFGTIFESSNEGLVLITLLKSEFKAAI